jgi:hypothetical protein
LDENEDPVEWRHFDTTGKLAPRNFGHAVLRAVRDVRRNATEDQYFNSLGAPARTRDGYAEVRRKYDERDDEIRSEYFDEKGERILSTFGYHAKNAKIDGGRVVRTWFEGLNGELVNTTQGFASVVTSYEEAGAVVAYRYFHAYPVSADDPNILGTVTT